MFHHCDDVAVISNKRDHNADLIRIISCLGVVGLHSFQEHLESANLIIYRICGFAIPMFFLVSGYFLLTKNVDFKYASRKVLSVFSVIISWNLLYFLVDSIVSIIRRETFEGGGTAPQPFGMLHTAG